MVGFFLLIALGALSTMVGLPYVVMKPGPITNTLGKLAGKQLITVSGAQTYPTAGSARLHHRAGRPAARATA